VTHIAIYADALAPTTSAVPTREMLLRLMQLRRGDRFIFVLCRSSENAPWWLTFRDRIDRSLEVEEVVLPWSRGLCNLKTLVGGRYHPRVSISADIYLRLDVGSMGPESTPLINLVLDTSSLKGARFSSMRWQGRRLFELLLREGSRLADRIVCISKATARDVADTVPEFADKVRVIHNGIADEWLTPSKPCALERQSSRPYFIWYGYIAPRKNIPRLLHGYAEALKKAQEPLPDLVVIGPPGIEKPPIKDEIERLGLKGRVHRMPPQSLDALIALVSDSKGLAFPSLFEGFGVPIVEAFARGVPVLTSNVTSMPEVAGGLAVLCDPEDAASIAEGLIQLAQPNQTRPERAAERRAYAERFTAERAATAYSALIDEVLSRRDA
jgi:glycosyltransferase involved in cell wall biosynthesis